MCECGDFGGLGWGGGEVGECLMRAGYGKIDRGKRELRGKRNGAREGVMMP